MNNPEFKNSIKKSITRILIILFVVLGVLIGYMAFRGYRDSIRYDYKVHLNGIIDFALQNLDADDLKNCVDTGEKSEKYIEYKTFLDKMVDYLDIMYIYIMIPVKEYGHDSMMYVIESDTMEEYAAPDYKDTFLTYTGDEYPDDVAREYYDAFYADDITYFVSNSLWGEQYTAAMPVLNSNGERFAIICADIDYEVIFITAIKYALLTFIVFLLISCIALLVLSYWINKNITGPIKALEERALDFANSCEEQENIDYVVFNAPEFHTNNELDSLAHSIKRMAHSIRCYVSDVINAHAEVENAKQETREMTRLAYKDALTRVKNKAAYVEEMVYLTDEISQGIAEFAILMIDINDLKKTNDTFGHEHGDEYIVGSCQIICDIFVHSSVFRIGGDEFIVILRNKDYENRHELVDIMISRFREAMSDENAKPWQRYSAAVGMGEYKKGDSVDDVFIRADAAMYKNKQYMKKSIIK